MAVANGSNKAEQILAWAQQHGEEFIGSEAAAALGVESHAVGSALRGLVSKGEVQIIGDRGGKRAYIVPPVEPQDVADYDPDAFLPGLKTDLADRLAALHEERNKLDAQVKAVDDEAIRIRAAYGVLKD